MKNRLPLLGFLRSSHRKDSLPGASLLSSSYCLASPEAARVLVRNTRKTELGANQFLNHLAVRAARSALLTAALLIILPAFSQQPGPKPKSQKEADALNAIQSATDADTKLKLIDELLTKYADTEYKPILLDIAVETARQKNDAALVSVWADRALQVNPKDYFAMLAIAETTAASIKEYDLNLKDEIARVDKNANGVITTVKDAPKPQVQWTDEQWAAEKKDLTSSAYGALGLSLFNQKKYPESIVQFKLSIDAAAHPDGATYVRLGEADLQMKQYDDAIAAFSKASTVSDAAPAVKQVAQSRKAEAEKQKAAAAAAPPKP